MGIDCCQIHPISPRAHSTSFRGSPTYDWTSTLYLSFFRTRTDRSPGGASSHLLHDHADSGVVSSLIPYLAGSSSR